MTQVSYVILILIGCLWERWDLGDLGRSKFLQLGDYWEWYMPKMGTMQGKMRGMVSKSGYDQEGRSPYHTAAEVHDVGSQSRPKTTLRPLCHYSEVAINAIKPH